MSVFYLFIYFPFHTTILWAPQTEQLNQMTVRGCSCYFCITFFLSFFFFVISKNRNRCSFMLRLKSEWMAVITYFANMDSLKMHIDLNPCNLTYILTFTHRHMPPHSRAIVFVSGEERSWHTCASITARSLTLPLPWQASSTKRQL